MSKFIDIETAPKSVEELEAIMPVFTAPANWKDEEKIAKNIADQKVKFIEKAALSPTTGTVMAIGLYDDEEDVYQGIVVADYASEADLLEEFWSHLVYHDAMTVDVLGWNIQNFDLPFLIKRSWANTIKVPKTVLEFYRGRASLNARFKDLMQYFCIGSDDRYMKLDDALDLLGCERKIEIEGLFYEVYKSNPHKAMKYLKRDVMALTEINFVVGV